MSTPSSTGSRLRRGIIDTVIALAVTIAAILVLEGAASALLFVQSAGDARAPSPLRRARTVPDSLLGWRNEPNASRPDAYGKGVGLYTTANGYRIQTAAARDTALSEAMSSRAKGSDTTLREALSSRAKSRDLLSSNTIACTGDSYTLGYGVNGDQTWCALLERALPGMHTINMGQEAHGLDQTYLLYRNEGARTPHALQILAVTNVALERLTSAEDAGWPKPQVKVEGGKLVPDGVPVSQTTAGAYRRSAIGRLMGDLRVVQALRRTPSFDPSVERTRAVDESRPVVEQLVAALQAAHKAAGTQLLLVYLPIQREIADSSLDERRAWLAGAAKQHGVAFFDLTASLRSMGRDSSDVAYFGRSSPVMPPGGTAQFSSAGHEWVARVLAPHVAPLVRR